MATSHTNVESPVSRPGTALRVVVGVLAAAVVAAVLNVLVAVVTLAAGASDDFRPLDAAAFVPLTVIGILLATAGWAVVRRTRRAASTLRWLVPAVLVVSWVPDLLVGISGSQPGTTWTGVVGLMVMHLVAAVVVVAMLHRVLPVHDR